MTATAANLAKTMTGSPADLLRRISGAFRLGLRLTLCLVLALFLGTAWAQGGNGGDVVSAAAPPPMGTHGASSHVATAVASPSLWGSLANVVMLPWVTVLLLVVGCVLLFHDLLTPFTWGITGTLGVGMVGLVFAAHVTQHTHGWIGVLLLLLGLALLLAEIHIVPGHGMAAIAGLLFLFVGMYSALGGGKNVAFSLSVSSILTVVTLLAFFAYLPKSPVWKRIGREMRQQAALAQGIGEAHASFLGRHGVVVHGLHPHGIAEIDGVELNVVTEGDFLSAGTPIVVSRVEGSRVVVESSAAAAAAEELRQVTLG